MERSATRRPSAGPVFLALSVAVLLSGGARAAQVAEQAGLEFFESRIRPALVTHCYRCHNSRQTAKAGLAVDSRFAIRAERPSGAAVVPGDPARSVLLSAIRHELDGAGMPADGPPLDAAIIADFERWILDGAIDPRDEAPTASALEETTAWSTVLASRKRWWSLQPISDPALPPATAWSDHPVDRFIGATLERHGLEPAPGAGRRALLRRLSYALTGLPPTIDEINDFLADAEAGAFERAVDRLLASPGYGERWARHWMDVVRYADSHGSEGDPPIPNAHQYRDYLVRAFNADVPYDQFVREHVAGDLLPEPRLDETLGLNESAIAVAHWRLVFHGFAPTDALDERVRFTDDQVNVFGKAFQALTISCARCHDHKFDAIGQADYYALFGVLASCRPVMRDVNTPERQSREVDGLRALKGDLRRVLADAWLGILPSIETALDDPDGPFAEPLATADAPSDALYVLAEVDRLAARGVAFEDAWRAQRAAFDRERAMLERDAAVTAVRDWDLGTADVAGGWYAAGNGLGGGSASAGAFAVASDGPRIVSGIYPAGVYTHMLSTKHAGVLASPDVTLDADAEVWFRLAGDGRATVRYAVQHYPRSGTVYPIDELDARTWGWHRRDLAYWSGDSVHFELATARDAPLEVRDRDRSWFGVRRVLVRTRGSGAPPEPHWEAASPLMGTASERPPANRAALVSGLVGTARRAISAWRNDAATDSHALMLDAWLRAGLLPNTTAELPGAAPLVAAYRAREATIPLPTRVPGIADAAIVDQPLLDRGDHRKPLDPVPRRFLEVLDFDAYPPDRSGRLELAGDLLHPDNPLTARVIVNRLWAHLFGRGIVATPDNFGRLGSPPSHPALLDHLATRLVRRGWSIKDAIRYIVSSKTWQLDSRASSLAREIDPENALLSHANPRRLDAHAIRDAMVLVSGRLDPRGGGPGFAANGNGTRRAVYITSRRNALDAFLQAFDAPVPFAPVGQRMTTNVPAQALTLMNDPFVAELARAWGAEVRSDSSARSDRDRIARMFEQALARPPRLDELDALHRYADACRRTIEERARRHARLTIEIEELDARLRALLEPARGRIRAARSEAAEGETGPTPIARWTFAEGLGDAAGSLHATLHGTARLEAGGLVLDGGGYAATAPLDRDLHEKTLEAWVHLATDEQAGGGVIAVQDLDGNEFDALVYAERVPRRWMAGSNGFQRTKDFGGTDERAAAREAVHVAITYAADGTVRGYRDGLPYGSPYRTHAPPVFVAGGSQVLFGLRHGSPTGNRLLRATIREARLYDRALGAAELASSARRQPYVGRDELLAALAPEQRDGARRLEDELDARRTALREAGDPVSPDEAWTRVAHAIFNLKEFIYLR